MVGVVGILVLGLTKESFFVSMIGDMPLSASSFFLKIHEARMKKDKQIKISFFIPVVLMADLSLIKNKNDVGKLRQKRLENNTSLWL